MGYFIFKTLMTALLIAGVSEISKRFTFLASTLAALPLTSIVFFLILPLLLKRMELFSALVVDIALTFGIYVVYLKVLKLIKPDIQL